MKLSIVIPVYNEEERLPPKLESYLKLLNEDLLDYELVLVNDGSTDGTVDYLKKLSSKNPKVRFIHNPKNRGRGFGMKTGVLAATGDFILETDADLPVSPQYIIKFMSFLEKNREYDYVIGSRGHKDSAFVVPQPFFRVLFGHIFHIIFGFFFSKYFQDVMCGFKMFRKEAAKEIFNRVYDERYLAAAEIILAGERLGYKLKELPVIWEDDSRSKVKIIKDSLRSFYGLGVMRLRAWQGKYDR